MTAASIINSKNQANYTIEKLFAFFVVLCAGGGSKIQSVLYTVNGSIIGTALVILISLYIISKHAKEIKLSNIIILIVFLGIWGVLGTINEGESRNYFYIIYNIFTSYSLFLAFKKGIFKRYVDIVSGLAAFSLVMFFVCLLIPPLYQFLLSFSYRGNEYVDLIVFRMFPIQHEGIYLMPYQNAGFAWEPGRYSCILVIALFFEMVLSNFQILRNKKFGILLVSLITTQSTTGYVCLLILLLMNSLRTKYKAVAITMISAVVVLFFSYSFLNDKIVELFNWEDNQRSNFSEYVYWRSDKDEAYVPERFEGLAYDFMIWSNLQKFIYEYRPIPRSFNCSVKWGITNICFLWFSRGIFVLLFLISVIRGNF